MGWTVLYIAFGGVAVWLLAEVLLQYKARLRWRLLAFGGFSAVVLGVLVPSRVVIALGAVAFAVGQSFVTLSYRRGFTAGWALDGLPGLPGKSRSREVRPMPPVDAEPVLEISDLQAHAPQEAQEPLAYQPEPMPDDTGQYGVYERDPRPGEPQQEQQDQYAAADYAGQPDYGQGPYGGQYAGSYGYGYGGAGGEQYEQYASHPDSYSDPYAGGTGTPAQPSYDDQYATASYDPQGYGSQGYDPQGYASGATYSGTTYSDTTYSEGYGTDYTGYTTGPADPYGGQQTYGQQTYGQHTPPGGVWVPQQRDSEPQGGSYDGYGTGGGHGTEGYGEGGYGTDGYDTSGSGYYYGEQPRH